MGPPIIHSLIFDWVTHSQQSHLLILLLVENTV